MIFTKRTLDVPRNGPHCGPFFVVIALLSYLFAASAQAQNAFGFDDVAAEDELQRIADIVEGEDADTTILANANTRVIQIETRAGACVVAASGARARLEERFEPLRDINAETSSDDVLDQRRQISTAIDEVTATQLRCEDIVEAALGLAARIVNRQNELSQQFLSNRTETIVDLASRAPERIANWPGEIRSSLSLQTRDGIESRNVFWWIVVAAILAAAAGFYLKHLFNAWYQRGGGDEAAPQLRYLVPKPLAEYAPIILAGTAIALVLRGTLVEPSSDLVELRIAYSIIAFGIISVIINWATGPLSPSAQVKGLIPDHVDPLRRRLRFVFLAILISYVVLGQHWLSVRVSESQVDGRASMILLVATAFLILFRYLPKIPGAKERYKLLRVLALTTTLVSIVAVLIGYQNLASFLIHGVTRTGIALFLLWILLWLVFVFFDYLIKEDTAAATRVRRSLGISKTGRGTGIGFMRLIADLVLWISFAVYMIYVWDDSGTTLNQLQILITIGYQIGSFQIVPLKIIGGILIFAFIIVLIGWTKRWIDRRWLQYIVTERGARDAIVTLIGYVGFVIAVLIALMMAEVDLTSLAIVSGALALGIGFGMQEIANNFVSGLILLFERPVRAGDFVTVGDIQGFVRSIRIRATEIETLDNQNVLVPNSELVSGRVTNWVLRDTHGRLLLKVGVAYGSDVEKVRDILESIAREHPEVITDGRAPAPRALFMGFGDSSLDFELRVRVQRIERRFSVMSDLNFAVDAAFRENNITIPFPQRDLHIVSYPKETQDKETDEPANKLRGPVVADPATRSHNAELSVKADIEDVWTALIDKETLERWLIIEGDLTPRIGGEFDVRLRDESRISGRIDVFMPPRRMRAVLVPADSEGPLASGPITIEYQLKTEEETTTLTVIISGIPDSEDWEEYYRLSVDRWNVALADLKSVLLSN